MLQLIVDLKILITAISEHIQDWITEYHTGYSWVNEKQSSWIDTWIHAFVLNFQLQLVLSTNSRFGAGGTTAPAGIVTATLYNLSISPHESNKYPVFQLPHMPKFHCSMNFTFRQQYSGCTSCSVIFSIRAGDVICMFNKVASSQAQNEKKKPSCKKKIFIHNTAVCSPSVQQHPYPTQ